MMRSVLMGIKISFPNNNNFTGDNKVTNEADIENVRDSFEIILDNTDIVFSN